MAASAARFRMCRRKGERTGQNGLLPKKFIHDKETIMKHTTNAKTFTLAALALGVAPGAKAEQQRTLSRQPEGRLCRQRYRILYCPERSAHPVRRCQCDSLRRK